MPTDESRIQNVDHNLRSSLADEIIPNQTLNDEPIAISDELYDLNNKSSLIEQSTN
jgi:hypothetical protein